MRRWLLVALTFPLIFAQYEQPTKTHDSYDKPLKVFGEANEHKAQEHLLEGPDGLPVVDPLAGYGREPPAPSIDLPGSEPLPPGPPTTAAPPAPESYNPVSSPGEAQRPGEETPSAASTAGPAKEKKEEAVATAEKATSTDDKYETAPAKTEEVATSPVPGSPSLPLDSSPPGGNENATAGAYQSPNGATVPAETADKAEISSSPASVENIVPETTAASVSEADTTAAFSQTESAKPESYEKPGGPAKEELKVPSPGSLETGSSPAAPIFQPASESSTPSAEAGYESAPGDQIVETQKTSLPTDTTQGQQESTAQTEGVVSSSAVYKTTPVEAAPTTTFKPEDTYVTSPDSPPEEKKPVVELLASGEKSSISSSGPQGETKPVENTISVPEQPAGNYEGSNEKAKTEAPVEAPSTVALSPSSEAPIESTAASSEPAYSTEASSISEVTTEQPKEEAKTGSPKSAEEMIPEHPPTLEEGYVPTGEKSVEVKADVTPAAAETIEGSGTTSAEKTNEYLKSGERSPKSGEIEGSGMIPVEEGSGLTSPAEQTPTTISVTVFAPSAPTSAEIQAATLPPYSAESPESVEGSGKSSETPEETTKSSASSESSESSTASSEQATPSSAEKAGYVEKVGGGEEKKSTEGSQEAPAEMKSPAETKKTEEPTAVGETKGAGGYEEKAKKVEGEKDLSEEKVILPFDVKTTPWQYVTAPGERTAKPGVTLQPEASRNDGEDVKTSVELETSSAIPTAEEKKSEKDILTTVTSTKITDKPSIEFSTDTTNNNMELEPSGYEMGHESVIFTPDLPPIKPEEAVGYDGIAKDESKQHDLPQRQDFNVNSGETKVVQRKIDRSFFLEEQRPKWTPYRFDCNTEEDEKGALCKEWAVSGLCEQHRPTMFLFCRKTCLCTGPFARRKRFAYSLF